MNLKTPKSVAILIIGFLAGIGAANLQSAVALSSANSTDITQKKFLVSIDEVKQNFLFGGEFVGSYAKTVTMSDGSSRSIKLTPMIHKGMQVVEFKDTGGVTYMGLNGTTTNGKLMVRLLDVEGQRAQLEAEGWPIGKK